MDIKIAGKGMDIGNSLKNYVTNELEKVVNKYFERSIDSNVVFSKHAHLFQTNIHILIGTGTGITIKSEAEATTAYASFDDALDKVSKQLRRYKKRLQNHHAAGSEQLADAINNADAIRATEYVFAPEHDADEENQQQDLPVVIAENNHQIESMKVRTAVMRMDLENAPLYMFRNEKNGHLNVIYTRQDGNIGWIDPEMCEYAKKNTKAA